MRWIALVVVAVSLSACRSGGSSPDGGRGDGGVQDGSVCVPTNSCEGEECGQIADGCGGTIECGTCGPEMICGKFFPNKCSCDWEKICAGMECGTIQHECGTVVCGSCPQGKTCGGGGVPNQCGCPTKTTCEAEGKNCGKISDGCGGELTCGQCTSPEWCGGGGVPNVCGQCFPTTCTAAGAQCGTIPDGCGSALRCATCADPLVCGGSGTANTCEACTGAWATEVLDWNAYGLGVGSHSALVVDAAGGVHVAYNATPEPTGTPDLKYAYRVAGGPWVFAVADPAAGPFDISMAIDGAGGLHVSYQDDDLHLRYAHRAPGANAWTVTVVDSSDKVGFDTAIGVDGTGGVHIIHVDRTTSPRKLKYAHRPPGGTWTSTTVPSTTDIGTFIGQWTALGVSSGGDVHALYTAGSPTYDLKHVFKPAGGAWTKEAVYPGHVAESPSIRVDAASGLHVTFKDTSQRGLVYAYKAAGGTWMTEVVDGAGDVGDSSSLQLGTNGELHVSYQDFQSADLKYAFHPGDGGTWTSVTVEDAGAVGYGTSLGLGPTGALHISYYDFGNRWLKYAYRCAP